MQKVNRYEKIVYVSHAFGGDENNLKEIEKLIRACRKQYPNYLFLSPCHAFGFLYKDTDYIEGLEMCLYMLEYKCDEMWYTPSNSSKGVRAEITACCQFNIPYYNINDKINIEED